jgi:hypothetical protein
MTRDRHDAGSPGERDLTVGRALDHLKVPDYPADFLASVWERVDEEDALAGENTAPAVTGGVPTGETTAPVATSLPERRARRRFTSRRLAIGLAAAVAAAAIVAVSLIGLPGGEKAGLGPQTAAAQLLSRIIYAMSQAHTLTGVVTQSKYDAAGDLVGTRSGPFAMRDDGSWRLRLDGVIEGEMYGGEVNGVPLRRYAMGYDATRHTAWAFSSDPDMPRSDWTGGIVPNSDARTLGGDRLLISGFAAGARAALAEGGADLAVTETTYKGRPAWKAVVPAVIPASPAQSPVAAAASPATATTPATASTDSPQPATPEPAASPAASHPFAEVVVDQETGLPVRVTQWDDGTRTVLELDDLRLDAALPDDAFAPAIPKDVKVHAVDASDSGLRFTSLEEARDLVKIPVPAPDPAPDGFQPGVVIVRGGLAPGDDVDPADPYWVEQPYWVTQEWHRGLDKFRIDVTAMPGSNDEIDDAIRAGFAGAPASRFTTLRGGFFDGKTAVTALGPSPEYQSMGDSGPGLAVAADGIMLTISGDLTRQEMLDVAESLDD